MKFQGKKARQCQRESWVSTETGWQYGLQVDDTLLLRFVQGYKYLGAMVSANASITPEIRHRCQKASQAFHELRRGIVDKKSLPVKARWKLLSAVTRARLLYGAESWPELEEREVRMLIAQDHKCMRWALGAIFCGI